MHIAIHGAIDYWSDFFINAISKLCNGGPGTERLASVKNLWKV